MDIKYILGINFLHSDSSACIFKDNILLAASEEERFSRIKHTSSFPFNAINFCLNEAKIDISKINYVAVNTNPFGRISQKILFFIKNLSAMKISLLSLSNSKKKFNLFELMSSLDKNNKFIGKIKFIDHHEAHIASSLYFSNFSECANLSIDGFGDFASSAIGYYQNDRLNIHKRINFPHSMGIFYQALTQFLGFRSYGDEYKLMGLAPYGKPKYFNELSRILKKTQEGFELDLKYFLHHKEKIFEINDQGQYIYKDLFSNNLIELLGKERMHDEEISQRHLDLAKSVQAVYEDVLFHLINNVYEKYNTDFLTISGGCAMNSVANGKILKNSNFKKIYISPNPGDGGGSIGSASVVVKKLLKYKKIFVKNYSFLGPEYSNEYIFKIIEEKKLKNNYLVQKMDFQNLYSYVAKEITKEKVIGWFQGRTEWGPRALGNRSILADPRNANIKDLINLKIKRRESFRPFAPSVLKDHVKDWFEEDNDVPYMSEVNIIKEHKRILIPGVTHVDGSGRLQTVTKEQNEHYYNLITEFNKLTGVPMLLNTSFNENEPIVNNPVEAINCYERTNMDLLILGNWVIKR